MLGIAACGAEPAGETHPGHGVVHQVDRAQGQITIDHEDIPGFMKGMTLTFEVSDPSILERVSSGREVDFRVRAEGDRYVITKIDPASYPGRGEGGARTSPPTTGS